MHETAFIHKYILKGIVAFFTASLLTEFCYHVELFVYLIVVDFET